MSVAIATMSHRFPGTYTRRQVKWVPGQRTIKRLDKTDAVNRIKGIAVKLTSHVIGHAEIPSQASCFRNAGFVPSTLKRRLADDKRSVVRVSIWRLPCNTIPTGFDCQTRLDYN